MTTAPNIENTPSVLDEALRLASHGIRVLPIKPGEKRPPMTAWQTAATCDAATITNWFTNLYRGHGLGVATGQMTSGKTLFVLDIDEHGNGVSGSDTLAELETLHGALPDTVEVHTGSGGCHKYFVCDATIKNDAGKRLGPGLDVRGEGGQVVAPPTLHPNGRAYVWVIDSGIGDIDIAEAPEWLVAKLIETEKPKPDPLVVRDEFLSGDSIADRYNHSTNWTEILTVDGWTYSHTDAQNVAYWSRPGKTPAEGVSASVGYKGMDILRVFTSSLPWINEGAYSRFGYFAHRHHDGDMSKAARSLIGTFVPSAQSDMNESTDDDWGDLIPLFDEVATPPFPLEILPSWLCDYVDAISHDLQVAVDLPANLGLGAIAVAVLGNATVSYPRQNWTQPLNLYMAVALPPSAGKSPAKSAIFSVLEDLEQKRIGQAAAFLADFESDKRIKEKSQRANEEKAAKSKGTEGDAAREEARALASEIALMPKPSSGKLLVDDITTEALGVELADAGGRIAVVSAEGGLFDRIAGLYSDQVANMDLYLEGWGGGRYSVSRIGRPPILVPKANVCVVTTVQPAVLDAIGARRDFSGRGFTARFLLTLPESNVGLRDRMRTSIATPYVKKAYESALTHIADQAYDNPVSLVVDGEASELFARWDQWLENSLAPGEHLEHMAEWVGKLRASVLRLAGLLHLAHGKPGPHIDVNVMNDAIVLGGYFLAHAQAIYARWGADGRVMQAQQILEWIQRTERTEFTARDLQRSNGRLYTTIEDTRAPLELLIERGWIRPMFSGPLIFGGRGVPSPKFAVRHVRQLDFEPPKTPKVSDMSDVSPKHIFEEDLLTFKNHKKMGDPVDMSDMSDNSDEPTHWSGLL